MKQKVKISSLLTLSFPYPNFYFYCIKDGDDNERRKYKLCMTVHRCLLGDGEAPRNLVDLITPSAAATARAGLRSATSGSVAVPRTTSSLGDRSFAVAAPRVWNKLPSPLRRVDSFNTSKRQLKTFLFSQALAFRFFLLLHIVRHPCCVSRIDIAVVLTI